MSRYIQQDNKKEKKEEKPRDLPKPGKYTVDEVISTKKIHSGTGGKI